MLRLPERKHIMLKYFQLGKVKLFFNRNYRTGVKREKVRELGQQDTGYGKGKTCTPISIPSPNTTAPLEVRVQLFPPKLATGR